MKSYLSSQLEVRAALSGELSRIFVPVKPQPASKYSRLYKEHMRPTWSDVEMGGQWKPPYPPESLVYFREKYFAGYPLDENDHFIDGAPLQYWYYADWRTERPFDYSESMCYHLFGTDKKDWPSWRSPATMPRDAARIYAKLGEPIVRLVEEITEEEAKAAAFESAIHAEKTLVFKKGMAPHYWLWIYPVTVVSTTGKP